jgi:hypothetical protein
LNSTGKRHPAPVCGAKCSADSDSEFDLLARAVLLVASLAIPEHDRAAVLARVVTAMQPATRGPQKPRRRTHIPEPARECHRWQGDGYTQEGSRRHFARVAMTTVQEIEKAIESLSLADQLRLYRDMPQLIGRAPEDLEWQRLAIEEFFRDDAEDDALYDAV